MENIPNVVVQIQEIQCDSKIGKSRHFFAADRKSTYQRVLGISVMIIGVLIGSTVVNSIPNEKYRNVVFAFMGLLSAGLSAFQTFFSFTKDIENHRRTGNMYLDIARDCDNLLSQFNDNLLDLTQCQNAFEQILSSYKKVTREEDVCPTSDSDYRKAYKRNVDAKKRVKGLKEATIYNTSKIE